MKHEEHLDVSSIQSTPVPTPQPLAVDTASHLHCGTNTGQSVLVDGSANTSFSLTAPMKNVSTNTSFEVERTPLALLGTATLIQQPRETLEAATNTSITVDEQEEAPVGQRKRLEGALMTNELLQAINASLHQELQSKDSRLDSMGQRLLDIIKRFQVR